MILSSLSLKIFLKSTGNTAKHVYLKGLQEKNKLLLRETLILIYIDLKVVVNGKKKNPKEEVVTALKVCFRNILRLRSRLNSHSCLGKPPSQQSEHTERKCHVYQHIHKHTQIHHSLFT